MSCHLLNHKKTIRLTKKNVAHLYRWVGGMSYRYATIRVNDAQTTKSEKLIKFHGKNSLKFKSDGCVRRPKIILFPSSAISCQFFPISNLVGKKGDVLMSFQSFYPGHTALKFRLVAFWQLSNWSFHQSSELLENWQSESCQKIRCPGFSISIFLSEPKTKFCLLSDTKTNWNFKTKYEFEINWNSKINELAKLRNCKKQVKKSNKILQKFEVMFR